MFSLFLGCLAVAQEALQLNNVLLIGGDGCLIVFLSPSIGEFCVNDEGCFERVVLPIDPWSIFLDLPRLRFYDHVRHLDHTGFFSETEVVPIFGSVETVYRGVHALVVRRVLGYYRELFTDTICEWWFGTSDFFESIDRQIHTFY